MWLHYSRQSFKGSHVIGHLDEQNGWAKAAQPNVNEWLALFPAR